MYVYIKQHKKKIKKINQKSRERERERKSSFASNCLVECHSMANRPDRAMKSWTALNINEFILFDMFRYPAFGRPQQLLPALFFCNGSCMVVLVFLDRMSTTRGPAWLKNSNE